MFFSDCIFDTLIIVVIGKKHPLSDECLYISPDASSSLRENNINKIPHGLLPEKESENILRIVVVSDTHGNHESLGNLPPGDVFVHCGDILLVSRLFSVKHQYRRIMEFNDWLASVPCQHKLIISGNHDGLIEDLGFDKVSKVISNGTYMENHAVTIRGVSLFGSPISDPKASSKNRAFQSREFHQTTRKNLPAATDILISHGHCKDVVERCEHSLHLWGHQHHSYGVRTPGDTVNDVVINALSVCAANTGLRFRITNHPIVLDFRIPEPVPRRGDPERDLGHSSPGLLGNVIHSGDIDDNNARIRLGRSYSNSKLAREASDLRDASRHPTFPPSFLSRVAPASDGAENAALSRHHGVDGLTPSPNNVTASVGKVSGRDQGGRLWRGFRSSKVAPSHAAPSNTAPEVQS